MKGLEAEILVHSCEPGRDPERLRSLLSQGLDEGALVEMALREGLAGFLYRHLAKSSCLEALHPKAGELLKSAYYRTLSVNLRLMQDLKAVLWEANQEKIRAVLLQGADLLHNVYDDVGLRPLTDVDLWVWKEDYPAMVNVLGRLGYERDAIYPTTFRRGATTLDLHTHVLWADRIRTRRNLINADEADILARARCIQVEGEEALCLDPSDQFLYLALHLLKHRASRLIWLVDLKSLVREWGEPDWKALVERARELGQEKTVVCMLYLLRGILGFPVPESLKALAGVGPLEKKLLQPRIEGMALQPWAPAFLYLSATGPIRGLPMLLESLFPRTEILRQMFPEAHDLGALRLYLKRIAQLAGMMSRK